MKENVFVQTRNVVELISVAERLAKVEAGVPGMGLVHGVKGLGKTTAAIYYASQPQHNAVYLRAKSDWSYGWMMDELLIELGLTPRRGAKVKYDDAVSGLVERPRLVIIDEANMINSKLLESLRSIHDMTHNPIMFIGHEGILSSLMRLGPFFDRLLYRTELKPLSLEDLKDYCAQALEMGIEGGAVAKVLKACDGNFRRSVVALKQLESKAKVGKLSGITEELLEGAA